MAAVAVDADADSTIGLERHRVLCRIIRCQDLVIAACELHQLPRCVSEIARVRRGLSMASEGSKQKENGEEWRAESCKLHGNLPIWQAPESSCHKERSGSTRRSCAQPYFPRSEPCCTCWFLSSLSR